MNNKVLKAEIRRYVRGHFQRNYTKIGITDVNHTPEDVNKITDYFMTMIDNILNQPIQEAIHANQDDSNITP